MNRDGKMSMCHASLRVLMSACLGALSCCVHAADLAAPVDLGRLYYTEAQRAQLDATRAQAATQPLHRSNRDAPVSVPAPLRYDGVMIRSDGHTTRWVDGKAQAGAAGVTGLKPGQIRSNGKVYEPYQVLRPSPAKPETQEPTP